MLLSEVPGSGTDDVWGASTAQFFHFRDNAASLEEIGVMRGTIPVDASISGAEMRLGVVLASASVQRMIGARAILGRTLTDVDDQPGAPMTAVLSEGFWRSQLGADPDLVGKALAAQVGAETPLSVEIVGVVASTGSASFDKTDAWWPNQLDPSGPHYNQHDLFLLAKRRPGVSAAAAQAEADGLTDQLADVYPDVYGTLELDSGKVDFMEQFGFRSRWTPLKDYLVGEASAPLWIAQGAIVLLLVVAWVAIANLFLARVETQRPEIAVRTALGAGRGAIVRQLAWTSTLIVAGAWLVGSGLAWWLAEAWEVVDPIGLPRSDDVGIDGGILASAAGVALLLVLSMVAMSVWRLRDVAGHLTDAGRGTTSSRTRQRARSLLIVAQVALAFVLLVGAGLLLSSFRNLVVADPGIDPRGVLKVNLAPDNDIGAGWWPLLKEVQDAATALPGVSVVGATQVLPFEREFFGCVAQHFEDATVIERLNASGETLCGVQDFVTPGYFAAAGIPVLRGRTLTVADFDDPSVRGAVVSRSFADKFFGGESPIGKLLSPYGWDWFTIVGVVGDIHAKSVVGAAYATCLLPTLANPRRGGLGSPVRRAGRAHRPRRTGLPAPDVAPHDHDFGPRHCHGRRRAAVGSRREIDEPGSLYGRTARLRGCRRAHARRCRPVRHRQLPGRKAHQRDRAAHGGWRNAGSRPTDDDDGFAETRRGRARCRPGALLDRCRSAPRPTLRGHADFSGSLRGLRGRVEPVRRPGWLGRGWPSVPDHPDGRFARGVAARALDSCSSETDVYDCGERLEAELAMRVPGSARACVPRRRPMLGLCVARRRSVAR